jgi:predicted flavoprotein YhiN
MILAVVGAGPAGLRAAEVAAEAGVRVLVYDAQPSAGRKFLVAGRGGLNLTHSEPVSFFPRVIELSPSAGATCCRSSARMRFAPGQKNWRLRPILAQAGEFFRAVKKAAVLLRAWLQRLQKAGIQFRYRAGCLA